MSSDFETSTNEAGVGGLLRVYAAGVNRGTLHLMA
jgi:hypothetical protein